MHSVAAARAPCAAPLAVRRATCTPRCQPVVQPWLRPAGAAITRRRNIAAQASKQTNVSSGGCGSGSWSRHRAASRPQAAAPAPALPLRHCRLPISPPSVQIEQVDSEGLEAAILNRDRPLIIDFYATWCGPCVLLAKELETVSCGTGAAQPCAACLHLFYRLKQRSLQCSISVATITAPNVVPHCAARPPCCMNQVAEKMGDAVRILKIDTDKNPDISTQLQVSQSFPKRE